jgi:hypothetical protein
MGVRRLTVAAVVALALAAGAGLGAQGTPPPAPENLRYQVDGRSVYLSWNNIQSPNNAYFYRLEAGGSPGTTFFIYDTSIMVDPNKLPQLLSLFSTGGVGNGNYYVRIRAANAGGFSNPSNEIIVPITGGCQAPAAPTDLTAIVRGNTVYLGWNPGSGGLPASYTLVASYSAGGAPIAVMGTVGAYLNVGGVPTGTYFVRVFANTPCGQSGPSNEIIVNAPSNSPARTPNATSGRMPRFWVREITFQFAQEAVNLGYLNGTPGVSNVSCPSRPGVPDSDIEARKTQRNPYIDHVVGRLRQLDERFGYNAKPTRANAIIAGDEIAYHWGSDAPEGSPNVYLTDVLGGHCTFGREVPDHRIFTDEFGRWTGAVIF